MTSSDVCVRSVGTALPGPAVDNATLAQLFGMPSVWQQWVDQFVGTDTRHFAVDLATGQVRHTLADLATTAAERALAAAGLAPGDVDVLVMGTASPDMLMPTTVNMVADRLGIDGIPTYQLQSGCAGAVQALDVAMQMLGPDRHRTALVLGGDTCAKHLDIDMDVTALPPAEQINGALFGDGAGAAVLSIDPGPEPTVVRHASVRLVGLGRDPGQIINWSGRGDRARGIGPDVVEDYKAIEDSVPELAAQALRDVLDQLGWDADDVDYLLPPQLSGRMTARISAQLGLPRAQEISCVRETGNTGNALPFFQLEQALPRMVEGDRAVGIAVESSKWIKAAFAVERTGS